VQGALRDEDPTATEGGGRLGYGDGAEAVVAAQGELVEHLAHREAELLARTDAPGDAGEGGVEPLRWVGGEPLGACGEGCGHHREW